MFCNYERITSSFRVVPMFWSFNNILFTCKIKYLHICGWTFLLLFLASATFSFLENFISCFFVCAPLSAAAFCEAHKNNNGRVRVLCWQCDAITKPSAMGPLPFPAAKGETALCPFLLKARLFAAAADRYVWLKRKKPFFVLYNESCVQNRKHLIVRQTDIFGVHSWILTLNLALIILERRRECHGLRRRSRWTSWKSAGRDYIKHPTELPSSLITY